MTRPYSIVRGYIEGPSIAQPAPVEGIDDADSFVDMLNEAFEAGEESAEPDPYVRRFGLDRREAISAILVNLDPSLSGHETIIHEWTPGHPPGMRGPTLASMIQEIREYCGTLGHGPAEVRVRDDGAVIIGHPGNTDWGDETVEASLVVM